ncbi:hypothetical protein TNCV_1726031 [Trichonephila clavipes]|nr:hypothetical protein TNCV_1726031 [Trichonephila clavipes]
MGDKINACGQDVGRGRGSICHFVVPISIPGGVQLFRQQPLYGAVVPHVLQDHDIYQQRHQPYPLQCDVY